ncbi:hypothetical protein MP228_001035 [Amoeboaphelidium protococcarum]|nr:hypothetical protein MP228_001035 [Amoeboaphelidium protococcarum]
MCDAQRIEVNKTGFVIDNIKRNAMLASKGTHPPKATKTGTTIVGVIYKDGVVLGADTRATEGNIVADKNCEKIHYLAPNMYCCGAGTAADTEMTTMLISEQLSLHQLASGRECRISTALTMLKQMLFKYQGHIGAALVLGGIDVSGPQLYTIYPHGSTDRLPFVTMGSGSLAAMAIFEAGWKKDMSKQQAIDLVVQAIEAGIFNDLGSGSNVDVTVLSREQLTLQQIAALPPNTPSLGPVKVEYLRNLKQPNVREKKERSYKLPAGTSVVLKSDFRAYVDVTEERFIPAAALQSQGGVAMEVE